MASVDTADEEMWRFLFDKDGAVTIPDALSPAQVAVLNAALDEHIAADWPAGERTMRFPLSGPEFPGPSGQGEAKVSLLDWDQGYRDVLDNPRISPVSSLSHRSSRRPSSWAVAI